MSSDISKPVCSTYPRESVVNCVRIKDRQRWFDLAAAVASLLRLTMTAGCAMALSVAGAWFAATLPGGLATSGALRGPAALAAATMDMLICPVVGHWRRFGLPES